MVSVWDRRAAAGARAGGGGAARLVSEGRVGARGEEQLDHVRLAVIGRIVERGLEMILRGRGGVADQPGGGGAGGRAAGGARTSVW